VELGGGRFQAVAAQKGRGVKVGSGGFLAQHRFRGAVQLLDRFDSAVVIGFEAGVEKLMGKFEAKLLDKIGPRV
jgi:hypothetical protein